MQNSIDPTKWPAVGVKLRIYDAYFFTGLTDDSSLLNFFPIESAAIWHSILPLYWHNVVAINFPKWPGAIIISI